MTNKEGTTSMLEADTMDLFVVTVRSELGIPFMGHDESGFATFDDKARRRKVIAYASLPEGEKLKDALRQAERMELNIRGIGYGTKANVAPVKVRIDELDKRGGSTYWEGIPVLA